MGELGREVRSFLVCCSPFLPFPSFLLQLLHLPSTASPPLLLNTHILSSPSLSPWSPSSGGEGGEGESNERASTLFEEAMRRKRSVLTAI